ncbi:hypothetical protein DFP72DRAFT_829136, partial [Ephemerocybe angulata]
MVGGYTQYLTRVQGMPPSAVKDIRKKTDNFVYAKHGERKANTIAIATLYKDKDKGGLNLQDIEAKNEAIDAMRVRTYTLPPPLRPVWCSLADRILARAAVKKYKNVGEKALINPFLQGWRVNMSAAGLPKNLKRMMKVGYKYHTRPTPIGATKEIMEQMPIWYHTGAKAKLVSIYGDSWGVCQREVHEIMYV